MGVGCGHPGEACRAWTLPLRPMTPGTQAEADSWLPREARPHCQPLPGSQPPPAPAVTLSQARPGPRAHWDCRPHSHGTECYRGPVAWYLRRKAPNVLGSMGERVTQQCWDGEAVVGGRGCTANLHGQKDPEGRAGHLTVGPEPPGQGGPTEVRASGRPGLRLGWPPWLWELVLGLLTSGGSLA